MSQSAAAALSTHATMRSARRLLIVLGDQLDATSPALRDLDLERDAVLMMEVRDEAEHVPSHRQRTALFLAAMRHFALELIDRGVRVRYVRLDSRSNTGSFRGEVERALDTLSPEQALVVQPGEHRVESALRAACEAAGVPLEVLPDESFTCALDDFDDWAEGRRELVMEYFYRERRRALELLVDDDGKPAGGEWNYDKQNREAFSDDPDIRRPYRARPDDVTREVLELVERTWPDAPGSLEDFGWPVTRREALRALDDFIEHRLAGFGTYEDAMWTGEPFLHHSLLSAPLNLRLLRPRECVDRAIEAYQNGRAELNDVEGFVRQLIGWREFIRGVYHREGEGYAERNELDQHGSLPDLFWTGETEMRCLRECVGDVLRRAYGHHIPRLMVIGNFALTAGVAPRAVHEWFLGMYVDAVEWATAPNVVGMSQHADGGVVGTKPYVASGRYISRMSNFCDGCRFEPGERTGDDACPFTTFYWDFLIRHRERFRSNRRMAMILKNVDRMDDHERETIGERADSLRRELGIGSPGG